MDVVDGQIMDTLRRLDPNFFDGLHEVPNSIAEFGTEAFYQAIVVLLWSCKPNARKQIPSRLLPQNMSEKFRCATTVVDAVKSIGVRDPVDYHMLLYGQSKELRNILIGLIEKLPQGVAQATPGMVPLKNSTENALLDLIRSANLEESYEEGYLTHCSSAEEKIISARTGFIGFCGDVMGGLHYNSWQYRHIAFICSLLENNAMNRSRIQNFKSVKEEVLGIIHLGQPYLSKGMKPQLKPKPVLSPELQKERKTKYEQGFDDASQMVVEKSETLNKLLREILAFTTYLDRKKAFKIKMQNDEAERLSVLQNKKLQESKIDERLRKLLENPNAILKLETYIDGNNERMQHLQNLWLRAKAEKDVEVKAARLTALSLDSTLPFCSRDTAAMATKLIKSELSGKKKILEKLRKEVELREGKQVNRSIYTKHIFEVVGNIRKQQNEINKVAVENLCLQKEIKSNAGKLERSFTAVEGKLYKNVEKDASMQKAYRLLMKIHGECSCIITGIDSAGQLEREIAELNEQIAVQYQKNTDGKLESIVNDWMEIKKENTALKELLKEYDN